MSESIGSDVIAPLQAMFDNYSKGKVTDEKFSSFVDRALERAPNGKAKAEILEEVVGYLPGTDVAGRDSDSLEIRYSSELANVSDKPDVAAEALLQNATATYSKARGASGDDRKARLQAALRSYIGCSKIICENLKERDTIPSPGVNTYQYGGSVTDPQYIAVKENHEKEVAARAYADQQNNMVELLKLMGPGVFKHLKEEMKLSDKEFARIWMEVETRKFDEGKGGVE
jgi:hypothetical protein